MGTYPRSREMQLGFANSRGRGTRFILNDLGSRMRSGKRKLLALLHAWFGTARLNAPHGSRHDSQSINPREVAS